MLGKAWGDFSPLLHIHNRSARDHSACPQDEWSSALGGKLGHRCIYARLQPLCSLLKWKPSSYSFVFLCILVVFLSIVMASPKGKQKSQSKRYKTAFASTGSQTRAVELQGFYAFSCFRIFRISIVPFYDLSFISCQWVVMREMDFYSSLTSSSFSTACRVGNGHRWFHLLLLCGPGEHVCDRNHTCTCLFQREEKRGDILKCNKEPGRIQTLAPTVDCTPAE